jgi:segregation and condensation protein B
MTTRPVLSLAIDNDAADAAGHAEAVRLAEALIFAASAPMTEADLAARLPRAARLDAVMADLGRLYAGRGIRPVRVAGGWAFRTAPDLAWALAPETEPQKLSRAALEVLAIIAYHQPATRAEIEEIRGVSTSKGTLDALLETRWIRMRGRRKAPGRPVTFGTTPAFLAHFGLEAITDLPGLDELKGLGFVEGRLPADLDMPIPNDGDALTESEDPLDPDTMSFVATGDDEA